MAPAFDAMSAKYTDVDFVKIDVDELAVRYFQLIFQFFKLDVFFS